MKWFRKYNNNLWQKNENEFISFRFIVGSFVCLFAFKFLCLVCDISEFTGWNYGFKRGNCRIWLKVENIPSIRRKSPPTNSQQMIKISSFYHFLRQCAHVANDGMHSSHYSFFAIPHISRLYYLCNYIKCIHINSPQPNGFGKMASFPSLLCLFRNIIRNFISNFCLVVFHLHLLAWVKCHLGSVDFQRAEKPANNRFR